jgi:hypothetical protein
MGLNLVVKRGTNQFHGGVRGYFDNHAMESTNVPDELVAAGVTRETSDHNKQISDYGFDLGGPILRDKAWFYGSYSIQDVQLVRRAGALVDETKLKNPDVKLNWQATKKDMISFLYFDGFKIKDGRSPGISGILFDAPTATYHQDNAYTDNPLHGLWKIADDRVFGPNLCLGQGGFSTPASCWRLRVDSPAGRTELHPRAVVRLHQPDAERPPAAHLQHRRQPFLNGMGATHDEVGSATGPPRALSAQVCGQHDSGDRTRDRPAAQVIGRPRAATRRTTPTSTSATRSRRAG